MTDTEFIRLFEASAFSREEWTHAAHVRAAWCYSQRECELSCVLDRLCIGIRRLNRALGSDPALYHETVTRAFGELIWIRATRLGAPGDWNEFAEHHPELFDARDPILLRHYSSEVLHSDRARLEFVPPDIAPLTARNDTQILQMRL